MANKKIGIIGGRDTKMLWVDNGDGSYSPQVIISGTGGGAVDTELPAAAALADATANPTAPAVATFQHGYNGTTWDRLRTAVGAATNAVATTPVLGVAGLLSDASLNWQIQRTASAVLDGVAGGAMASTANWVFNGATFDRLRTASADALAATGLLASGSMVWNGATWDRAKGNTTAQFVQGTVADNVTSTANPVLIGGLVGTTLRSFYGQSQATDGLSTGSIIALGANALQYAYNGSTIDRLRNNVDVTLLASGTRSTIQTSADITTYNAQGIHVTLDMTVVGTGSVTVTINGKDPASGKYYLLLSGAAVITNVTNVYKVYPGLPATANVSANDHIPRTIQIVVTHNNANNAIYSVGYTLLV